jgi:hypothetical protein
MFDLVVLVGPNDKDFIEPKWRKGSGASEYEIYFNYMLIYNPEIITIRQLKNYNCQDKKMKLLDNMTFN